MNYEYIDRIVIAAENQIQGKTEVSVELVKVLVQVIKDLNGAHINQIYGTQQIDCEQLQLTYNEDSF